MFRDLAARQKKTASPLRKACEERSPNTPKCHPFAWNRLERKYTKLVNLLWGSYLIQVPSPLVE